MFVDTMTNKEYLSIANSPMLWVMVIPTVIAMCMQAFGRRSTRGPWWA